MIPPKWSNHLTECKRGLVGNTRLLPRAKMLRVPKIDFSGGYIIFWVLPFHTERSWHLFLFGMICPLMQEHFLRPLLKRKSLPLRLNKSFRLFILLQSASWIWITKGDILLSVNVMVSFNFCHAGPSSFSISACRMLNFHRKWFAGPNFEEWIIGTHFVNGDIF